MYQEFDGIVVPHAIAGAESFAFLTSDGRRLQLISSEVTQQLSWLLWKSVRLVAKVVWQGTEPMLEVIYFSPSLTEKKGNPFLIRKEMEL